MTTIAELKAQGMLKNINFKTQPLEPPKETTRRRIFGKIHTISFGGQFAKGEKLVIDDFGFSRKGLSFGDDFVINLLNLEAENAEGKPYSFTQPYLSENPESNWVYSDQMVEVDADSLGKFPDIELSENQQKEMKEKGKVKVNVWHNLVSAALRKAEITYPFGNPEEGVWFSAEQARTGQGGWTPTNADGSAKVDRNGKEIINYPTYFCNIVFYKTEEEMRKAAKESGRDTSGGLSPDEVPEVWVGNEKELAQSIQDYGNKGASHQDIAKSTGLLDPLGNPVKTKSGADVNIPAILSTVLDIPQDMVKL